MWRDLGRGDGVIATFTPPLLANAVPQSTPTDDRLVQRCMNHFAAGSQGRNVYILKNGTVTEVDPDGTTVKWSDVSRIFWGGHVGETVSAAEATLLTNAGYTVT